MSIKVLPEQVQADVRDTQQEQQRIHSQIQGNARTYWAKPSRICTIWSDGAVA